MNRLIMYIRDKWMSFVFLIFATAFLYKIYTLRDPVPMEKPFIIISKHYYFGHISYKYQDINGNTCDFDEDTSVHYKIGDTVLH